MKTHWKQSSDEQPTMGEPPEHMVYKFASGITKVQPAGKKQKTVNGTLFQLTSH